jgi:hypothetical protein
VINDGMYVFWESNLLCAKKVFDAR